jgi:hypothetical protein
MAEQQKSNSTSLSFFQVSESGLKPNQAIALLAVEGVTIRSNELSRALTPLVLEFVKKWVQAEEERAARESSADPEYIDMDSEKVPSVLVEKSPLEWNMFKRLGGKLSHFQRKVVNEVKRRKFSVDLDPAQDPDPSALRDIAHKPNEIRSRRTSKQVNVEWRNHKATKQCTDGRFNAAFKQATVTIHGMQQETIKETRTQQQVIDDLNLEFGLDGEGKENSREKKMLVLRTVRRAISNGHVGLSPLAKGKSAEISREWVELVATHINMRQVSTVGEADVAEIKATMQALIPSIGLYSIQRRYKQPSVTLDSMCSVLSYTQSKCMCQLVYY